MNTTDTTRKSLGAHTCNLEQSKKRTEACWDGPNDRQETAMCGTHDHDHDTAGVADNTVPLYLVEELPAAGPLPRGGYPDPRFDSDPVVPPPSADQRFTMPTDDEIDEAIAAAEALPPMTDRSGPSSRRRRLVRTGRPGGSAS